jgi:hypothetical protein
LPYEDHAALLKLFSILLAAFLAGSAGIAAAQGAGGDTAQKPPVDCKKTPDHPDCKKQ